MKIILNNSSLLESLRPFKDVGYVPTMGGIHDGHLSLIHKSNQVCNTTIVSIFLNPKQFNNKNDLKSYPSNLAKDISILRKSKKVDFVYVPKFNDIYENKKKSKIIIDKKDKVLCAKFRKGHFEGVLDVMNILTKLINPNKIFMGKKDFQQFYLVKKFLENKYKTKVIGCKIIRDNNGIALSSRNFLLKKNELNIVSSISKQIIDIKKIIELQKNKLKFLLTKKKEIEKKFHIKIEYLELRKKDDLRISKTLKNSRLFVAYYIRKIRLIDNF